MKKVIISFIIVCVLIMHIPVVKAENKVKVYMFTKHGCSACQTAYDYFNDLLEENPDLFELVTLEVWSGADKDGKWILASQDLLDLMVSALDKFGEDTNKLATPTIAVGDYLQVGANNLSGIYNRILELKDSEEAVDTIAELAKENNINIDELKGIKNTNEDENNDGKYDAYILIGIFIFVIGGFVALLTFGRKK